MRVSTETTRALWNGARGRCPRCGEGRIYAGWAHVAEACARCGLRLRAREADTWFFMYMSTAFLTGLFILAMLFVTPLDHDSGRVVIFAGAMVVIVATVPIRKGIAIAIDVLIDSRLERPRHPDQA